MDLVQPPAAPNFAATMTDEETQLRDEDPVIAGGLDDRELRPFRLSLLHGRRGGSSEVTLNDHTFRSRDDTVPPARIVAEKPSSLVCQSNRPYRPPIVVAELRERT